MVGMTAAAVSDEGRGIRQRRSCGGCVIRGCRKLEADDDYLGDVLCEVLVLRGSRIDGRMTYGVTSSTHSTKGETDGRLVCILAETDAEKSKEQDTLQQMQCWLQSRESNPQTRSRADAGCGLRQWPEWESWMRPGQ